jgi:hypothetical protein
MILIALRYQTPHYIKIYCKHRLQCALILLAYPRGLRGRAAMEFAQYFGLTGLAFFVLFILEELLGYPFDAKR